MLSRQDPEYSRERDERIKQACEEFAAGEVSVHVLRAKLYGLQVPPDEMEFAVSLYWRAGK